MRLVRRAAVLVAALAMAGAVVYGQRGFGGSRRPPLDVDVQGNTPYDGRFTFVRLRYNAAFGRWRNRLGNGGVPWSHDYPEGEVHFSKILQEITLLRIRTDGSNILSLDDPELCKYPVAYMAEPGYWQPSPSEAEGFRKYLLKGGFAIFDDFRGPHWDNLQYQMRQVLPDAQWVELDGTAQIFHSFFEIDHPENLAPPYNRELTPSYWGIYESNDPTKRLMVIANVNNDISEYWEYSGTGYAPVDVTNEAYKFGINYVIYGLTH
jgi:hypothetical protein